MPVFNHFALVNNKPDPMLLQQAGPLLQVAVALPSALEQMLVAQNQPVPPPQTGWALIDTGATKSCVDGQALSKLSINPIGIGTTGTAGGPVQQQLFPAKLHFPGVALVIEFSSVIGVNLAGQHIAGTNLIVLVGRDVLSRCSLTYNGPGGFFTLAY